ncbi:ABC transporter permease [Nannocystaceae bacterium ST9]
MSASEAAGFMGHGSLRRHLGLLAAQLRISVLAALEYRTGFWSQGVMGLLWSLGGVIPLWVALQHRSELAGWSVGELGMLTGCYVMLAGVFAGFVQPGLAETMDQIRRGTLDYVLLRPSDPLIASLGSAFAPWSLLEILAGLGLLIASALITPVQAGPIEIAELLVVGVAGLVALYALGVLVLAASFRALQLENLTYLMESLLDFARWPISVFRGPLKLLFTFVVPFAIMTSYPAQALAGELDGAAVAGAIVTALVLAGSARALWSRALRGYTSASS